MPNWKKLVTSGSDASLNSINVETFVSASSINVGTIETSGHILPSLNDTYDLGSPTHQWRDLYLSSASLYINGSKVLSTDTGDLTLSTDINQSLRIVETGADTIGIQTENGDITITNTGIGSIELISPNGAIELNAPVRIGTGKKILSNNGGTIEFGDSIGVTGSIETTGTVDGVDIQSFSSSLNSRVNIEKNRVDAILSASSADLDSFAEIVSLVNSIDTDNDNTFASFYTASNGRLGDLETFTSSFEAKTLISESNQIIQLGFASTGSNTFTGYQEFDQGFESTIGDSTVSHFTYNNESGVPVEKVQLRAIGSGSYSEINNNPTFVPGNISIEATSGSDSIAKLYADQIQIGAFGTSVNIGNQGSDIIVGGSTILLHGNTAVSGSVDITGSVTASHFVGDGSQLTGIESSVVESTTVVDSFSNKLTHSVPHNFGTKNVIVSVYDNNDTFINPASIATTDDNTVAIEFCENTSGRVVVAKGGHIVSGSIELYTHKEPISGSASYSITHNLNEDFPIIQVYDTLKKQVIPKEIQSINLSTVQITFCDIFTGMVVVKK